MAAVAVFGVIVVVAVAFLFVVVVVVVKIAVVVVIVFVSDGVGAFMSELVCKRASSASPLASSSHMWTLTIGLRMGNLITETISAMPMDNALGSAQTTWLL